MQACSFCIWASSRMPSDTKSPVSMPSRRQNHNIKRPRLGCIEDIFCCGSSSVLAKISTLNVISSSFINHLPMLRMMGFLAKIKNRVTLSEWSWIPSLRICRPYFSAAWALAIAPVFCSFLSAINSNTSSNCL